MSHDTLARLAGRDTVLHRLDPRTRAVAILLALAVIASEPRSELMRFPLYYTWLAALLVLARVPAGTLLRRCGWVAPFILGSAAVLPLSLGAPAGDGAVLAAGVALKGFASVGLLVLLVATGPLHRLLAALGRALPPTLAATLVLVGRYGALLNEEAHRLRRARDSRAPRGLRTGRLAAHGRLAALLFLRGWERSLALQSAMLARGFSGVIPTLRPARLTRADIGWAILIPLPLALARLSPPLAW